MRLLAEHLDGGDFDPYNVVWGVKADRLPQVLKHGF